MGDNFKTVESALAKQKEQDRKEILKLVGGKQSDRKRTGATTPIARVAAKSPAHLEGARGAHGLAFEDSHHKSVDTPGRSKEEQRRLREERKKAYEQGVSCSRNLDSEILPSTVTLGEEFNMVERTADELLVAMQNSNIWDPQAENIAFNQELQQMEDDMGNEFWNQIDTLMREPESLYIEANDMTMPFIGGKSDDVNMDTGEFLKQNIPIKF